LALLPAVLAGLVALTGLQAEDKKVQPEAAKGGAPAPEWTNAVKPKPLSENVKKGLAYLVSQQHPNGGWGQGGGWRQGNQGSRVEGKEVQDPPDVANTCIATLALLRAGHTAKEGEYAKNVAKALDYIFNQIEKADKDSLYVTDARGTQLQSKIGPYVDTFLASLVLAEMKGRAADAKSEARLTACLTKTIAKIERNQKADGTFAGNDGWASVLSQGLAGKGLNRARQAGVMVQEHVLAANEKVSVDNFDAATKSFKSAAAPSPDAARVTTAGAAAVPGKSGFAPAGAAGLGAPGSGGGSDAGVSIYNFSAQTANLREAVNTNKELEKKAQEILARTNATKAEKDKARADLDRFREVEKASDAATGAIVKRLGDQQFVQGFGSNGGEEFLSYMNNSETLLVKGGKEWETWDKSMTANLNRIQDKDGGWSGQHCITGRTFCTASALLVLMADRAPVPLAAKMKSGK
jgi:hypothetical protein